MSPRLAMLGIVAGAAACVAGVAYATRRHAQRPAGFLYLDDPFIDSEVADRFLAELEQRRQTAIGTAPQFLILHTYGGNVTACAQIAHALLEARDMTIFAVVPIRAFSGGTLIALSADVLAMGDCASLSAIDPIVDSERARHFEAIDDSLGKLNAKEHLDAMMGLLEKVLDRRDIPDERRRTARALFDGSLYPHTWPLSPMMLRAAGVEVEPAPPFWTTLVGGRR